MLYIGRIVSVAMTKDGRLCAAYRVSSRSFPNRMAVVGPQAVSIVPQPGHEADLTKNVYISYNCARIVCEDQVAVVTNGSQTDPVAEKMAAGMSARDALVISLLALDYEKDSYNTPRICAVADKRTGYGWLGIVRHDGLEVQRMPLDPGRFFYIATYEENSPSLKQSGAFAAENAKQACEFMLKGGIFAERSNPITAVAAMATDRGFELATEDVPKP